MSYVLAAGDTRFVVTAGLGADSGAGVVANQSAFYPSVSSDGNLVVFASAATNFAAGMESRLK